MENLRRRKTLWIFFLGSLCGVAGETLLFMRQQCRHVESSLSEDFRVLAFLNSDLSASKGQILEEEVRALPGVVDVRHLSRDSALTFLKERDPEMIKSVSVLGENPLNSVLEIQLTSEMLPQLSQWIDAASKLPELSDLRFKPLQVQAILQVQFYRHFLDLAMSLVAVPWFLGAVLGLWYGFNGFTAPQVSRVLLPQLAAAAAGTLAGMGAVYAAAVPMNSAPLWLWPSVGSQAALLLAGLAAGLWIEQSSSAEMHVHKPSHPEIVHHLKTPA